MREKDHGLVDELHLADFEVVRRPTPRFRD
jgi:hypothetical protein